MAEDPDREILGQLLHAWKDRFDDRPTMVRDAVSNASSELREAFLDIAGDRVEPNRKRLGRWISRHAGRIVDGLRFEKDSCTRSAEAWRVKSVMLVSTVSVPVDIKNGSTSFSLFGGE